MTVAEKFVPDPKIELREARVLTLTLVSAEHLPECHLPFRRMKVCAEVSLNVKGESRNTKRTNVDVNGGSNPIWDFEEMEYTIILPTIHDTRVNELIVKLLRKRRSVGYSRIGDEVRICVNSLLDSGIHSGISTYRVEGTDTGRLNIAYSFGRTFPIPQN